MTQRSAGNGATQTRVYHHDQPMLDAKDTDGYSSDDSEGLTANDVGPFVEGNMFAHRWSQETALSFGFLLQNYKVLLLTPDLDIPTHPSVPPGEDLPEGIHGPRADPFEPMVQSMKKRHHHLVHRKYDTEDGLSEETGLHLVNTDNVILVMCEPTNLALDHLPAMMQRQRFYVDEALDDYHEANKKYEPPAIMVIYIGKEKIEPLPNAPIFVQTPPWPDIDFEEVSKFLMDVGRDETNLFDPDFEVDDPMDHLWDSEYYSDDAEMPPRPGTVELPN